MREITRVAVRRAEERAQATGQVFIVLKGEMRSRYGLRNAWFVRPEDSPYPSFLGRHSTVYTTKKGRNRES
jgi:hypothetical protein